MTEVTAIELTCPCCGRRFPSAALVSTSRSGKLTTDLWQQSSGIEPLPYEIHTCTHCGYTSRADKFEEHVLSETVKKRVLRWLTPALEARPPDTARRYEFAAWIEEWRGGKESAVGFLYHQAAWCSRVSKDEAEERRYAQLAVHHFERSVGKGGCARGEVLVILCYLIGELSRRVGDREKAQEWLTDASELAAGTPGVTFLSGLAEQQLTEPQEYVDLGHMPRSRHDER